MTRLQVVSGDLLLGGRRFPAVWLRDNCPGPEGRDQRSGQKLFGITDIPNEIVVSAAGETAESVTVIYSPGGHRSTFRRSWLETHRLDGDDPADYRAEDARLRDCLIMDNTPVLHGRTAFAGAGERHLQECYADLDSLASSLAVLERTEGAM